MSKTKKEKRKNDQTEIGRVDNFSQCSVDQITASNEKKGLRFIIHRKDNRSKMRTENHWRNEVATDKRGKELTIVK